MRDYVGSENYFFMNREKASLDIFWLRDESLEESDNLPDPEREMFPQSALLESQPQVDITLAYPILFAQK
jgi:hypothetical protein